jgi:DNA-directed RNA polymerase
MDWIRQVEEKQKELCPFSLPMVVPPRDWLNPFEGGYFTDVPFNTLLKSGNEEAAQQCTGHEAFVVAANHQQAVGYRINGWLLDQVQHAWDKSMNIGCLMPREGYEIPPYPKHLPDDHPDVTAWRFNARQLHEANDKSRNKRIVTAKQLWIARRFRDEPALYFPMQLDFRGRYYYRPPFINPQGNDIGRALLLFANGMPIANESQANWLRVHGANAYGHSKLTWQARLDWVHQHQLQIEAVGRDPWGHADFWTKASDPWQFLAFCREYQQFSHHGHGYVGHLPVVLDCTCSGIQHYAALLRSDEMAPLVNLMASEKPQDIYTAVLNTVLEQLRNDAAADNPHAQGWLQLQPDRTLAKPIVMTLPYSATRQAVFHFCQVWALERTLELYGSGGWCFKKGAIAAMHYMATILYRETSQLIGPAKQAMTWFKRLGNLAGDNNIDLHWTSPSGLRVGHRYMDYTGTRIRLYHLSSVPMDLLSNHIPKGLNPKRMGNGLSPNVIHSLDASHMAFTTIDAFARGVRNLGGIHDCFATTPAEMDTVRDCVRNSFADLYSKDWFTLIADELLQQLPVDLQHRLPSRPMLGGLDVNHVRNATYFIT